MIYLLLIPLVLSIGLNVYLIIKRPKLNKRTHGPDLGEFIADLANGTGIVQITRIAPMDVLLRRR